ncbi:endonuclease domain-containing protein [Aestuariimicrobium kwangyangense]|uniref:endonuclease domain-containing protein n=1 Tax=Aestuariimicrobium kwangyangense TaxID=396389 RepID=UPI00047E5ABD|nr:DUF559 domain-containing protein [Aestuariimicrobium kwangyangense]
MVNREPEIVSELRRRGGCLRLADAPHLAQQARRLVRSGECKRPFPGVVVASALADDPATLTRALALWQPNAVLLGRSAARLTHWPSVPISDVEATLPRLHRTAPAGVTLSSMRWPDGLLQSDTVVRTLTPPAGALWSGTRGDLELAFRGFRDRVFQPSDLRTAAAIAPYGLRKEWERLALELRSFPWSHPELELHRMFRRWGLRGWRGNHRLLIDGSTYFGDAVFVRVRRIVEVASDEWHSSDHAIAMDYRRHNALEGAGWRVIYVTPTRIRTEPALVMREVLALLNRQRERGVRVI